MTITEDSANVYFNFGGTPQQIIQLNKGEFEVRLNGDWVYVFGEDNNITLSYLDVSSPVVVSALDLYNQLTAMNTIPGGNLEVFTAAAGQTVFTPVVAPHANTRVYVNGALQVGGWSVVGATVVFAVGLLIGTQVVIIS